VTVGPTRTPREQPGATGAGTERPGATGAGTERPGATGAGTERPASSLRARGGFAGTAARAALVVAFVAATAGVVLGVAGCASGTSDDVGPSASTTSVAAGSTESMPGTEGTSSDASARANADVTFVGATQTEGGTWTFSVTVEHPDTGWDEYADGWDVVTPDGTVLKARPDDDFTRLLTHPHVDEQPFTRSQAGIVIPQGVMSVRVRAHDIVDGFGGREIPVDLTESAGEGFEVENPIGAD
jgi:hypothetical protein